MKKKYFFFFLIVVIVLLKQYFIVDFLNQFSLPVFDGVMNEKGQIIRYLNFKNDFSVKQRLFQAYYELTGNPVTSFFNVLVILFHPKMLINDLDVYFRSVFVLLVLIFTLDQFLKINQTSKLFIIVIVLSYPLLTHYRFGTMTYIPDLSSGILLLCAYLNSYLFILNQKFRHYFNVLWMILFAVGFRYNFFIYTFILFLPILIFIIKIILNKSTFEKCIYFIVTICFLASMFFYFFIHFDFFIEYYLRPASYFESSLSVSINDLWKYYKRELGLTYFFSLVLISLIYNLNSGNNTKRHVLYHNLFFLYPFFIFFLFLIIYLNAANQPHVFSFLMLFSLLLGFIKINLIKKYFVLPNVIFKYYFLLFILFNSFDYSSKLKNDYKKELTHDGIKLANYIERHTEVKEKKKYFILFDTALEIPLDVYFFRKYKIWNDNSLKFYFTNWDFYGISKKLNETEIINYYVDRVKQENPKLIFVNKNNLQLGTGRKLASNVNKKFREYISRSTNYYLKDSLLFNQKLVHIYMLK